MPGSLPPHIQQLFLPGHRHLLTNIRRGIEKESLRMCQQAKVAQTPHPSMLGSALTHSYITTDYSEALLEFITPVSCGIEGSMTFLNQLHSFATRHIGDELLWPASMPCFLEGEESVPIADYGQSHLGRMKHVYRQGLGYRYGRKMQAIAGIHYNFSMPDEFWPAYQSFSKSTQSVSAFRSDRYFALIRNFRRYSWLLNYLFGASPIMDSSFFAQQPAELVQFGQQTLGLPFATSLRMSGMGYQSQAQASLAVSYNHLDCYLRDLELAMNRRYPAYEKIGIDVNGNHRQLNSNVLQLENELYSDIRPKRVAMAGERQLTALRNRGVEYIEVRTLDVNPLLPVGIDAEQIRFLDAFLLYCLLSESPEITASESADNAYNHQQVLLHGRNPSLTLRHQGKVLSLKTLANQLLDEILPVIRMLDIAHHSQSSSDDIAAPKRYGHALDVQRAKIDNSDLTPSGQIMQLIAEGDSFVSLMLKQAENHRQFFARQELSVAMENQLAHLAWLSRKQQQQIEAEDTGTFDSFIRQYFAA